jgi:hypothetical protein
MGCFSGIDTLSRYIETTLKLSSTGLFSNSPAQCLVVRLPIVQQSIEKLSP